MSASVNRLFAHAEGEVELEGSVLVLKRIHCKMELRAPEKHRPIAEKVHGVFAQACPVYDL